MLAVPGCIDNPAENPSPDPFVSEYRLIWDLFDSRYVGFMLKGTDWNQVYQQFLPEAEETESREEMTALAVEMLSILEDRQIVLYDPAWLPLATWNQEFFTNCDSALLMDYLSPYGFQWMQQDIWGYCLAGGDSIPYFVFADWNPELNLSLLDNVLFPLKDSPAIILDARLCGGGSREPGINVARRFVDQQRTGFLTQRRAGPEGFELTEPEPYILIPRGWHAGGTLVVLAGQRNAAAAEVFLSCVGALPQAVIMGDTTMGSSNWPVEVWELPEGWHVSVPGDTFLLPDSSVIEGAGIIPDQVVEASGADFSAGVDPVLEYAFQWLGAGSPVRSRK
jgi:hypothetical protein